MLRKVYIKSALVIWTVGNTLTFIVDQKVSCDYLLVNVASYGLYVKTYINGSLSDLFKVNAD